MDQFNYRVQTSTKEGVFNFGTLDLESRNQAYSIPLPVKTTPVKKCNGQDDIFPEFKQINEVYHSIDSVDLRNAIYEDNPSFVEEIKKKQEHSEPGQLDIVLLNYDETKAMTPMEALEYVRAIDEVSEVITCPLQFPLLHSFVDNEPMGTMDNPFEYFKITKENFFDAVSNLDTEKPVMGSVSFIPTGRLNRLLQLYDDFAVDMIGVDFYRGKPTSIISEELGDLLGRLTAFDLFDGTIMFGYNMPRLRYRHDSEIRLAENFALAGMGFDIIGGDHLGLAFAPKGDRKHYSVFDPDIAGYRPVPVNDVEEEWPVTVQSKITPERVASFQPSTASDLVKLVNTSQVQMALGELRTRLEQGNESNFLQNKKGINKDVKDAFRSAVVAYSGGSDRNIDHY